MWKDVIARLQQTTYQPAFWSWEFDCAGESPIIRRPESRASSEYPPGPSKASEPERKNTTANRNAHASIALPVSTWRWRTYTAAPALQTPPTQPAKDGRRTSIHRIAPATSTKPPRKTRV